MKKYIEKIRKRYEEKGYIQQRKSLMLFYFALFQLFAAVTFITTYIFFIPERIMAALPAVIVVFLAGSVTIILLFRGKSDGAGVFNSLALAFMFTVAQFGKVHTDIHLGYTTFIYLFIVPLTSMAIFGKKKYVIPLMVFLVAADFLYFLLTKNQIEGIILAGFKTGLALSILSIVTVGMFLYTLNNIMDGAIEVIGLEAKRNYAQFQRIQRIMASMEVAEKMSESAVGLSEVSTSLASGSQKSSASLKRINDAAESALLNTRVISSLANDQEKEVTNVAHTSDSLNTIMKELSNLSKKSTTLTEETLATIQSGETSLEKTIEAIEEIEDTTANIAEINKSIQGIASQVNMLALNASIEATRAGEAGKGFAVVADEISLLSEKTSRSAHNILSLVKEESEKVEVGTMMAAELIENFSTIVMNVREMGDFIQNINEGVKKGTKFTDSIDAEITLLQHIIEDTKNSAQEQVVTNKELNYELEVLSKQVGNMERNSKTLDNFSKEIATNGSDFKEKMEEAIS